MKCSEGVNEMSGLGGGREGGSMIFLTGSNLSAKNERSCKNGGLKRIMFGPSHAHLRSYFCFIQSVPKK